jgi:hypothetical protein
MRNEAHITNGPFGHTLSTDCWCEPNSIRWVINAHGIPVLVVEHNDEVPAPHLLVTAIRERDKNEEYVNDPNNGWITRVLEDLAPPGKEQT